MKRLLSFLVLAVGLFVLPVVAENGVAGTEYGFTHKAYVTNSYVWTNDNAYPFKIVSLQCNTLTIPNTTTVVRIRDSYTNQYVGNVCTTNILGYVHTNFDWTITNKAHTYLTNTLAAVTNAGSTIWGETDIEQQYILLKDVLIFTISDNAEKILIFDAIR